MGLLDQVIGQVIGQMAGSAPREPQGGGFGGGLGGGLGGALGNALPGGLGGLLGGRAGQYAPLVMALLAILANKHLSTGAGGYGSVLHDILGRLGGGGQAAPEEPDAMPSPAPVPSGGPGGAGGFLDSIGGMLGGGSASAPAGGAGSPPGSLDDLLKRLGQSGHADTAASWVGTGANAAIAPDALERALGPDTIDALARQTGADRGTLLDQLAEALPQVVDGLTPAGRVPDAGERSHWI